MPNLDIKKRRALGRIRTQRYRIRHPILIKRSARRSNLAQRRKWGWALKMYNHLRYLSGLKITNPVIRRQIEKRYRQTHLPNLAEKASRRRTKERQQSDLQTPLCKRIYWRAHQWRNWGFDVVVDHIFPLAKGGLHTPKNLQIIYRKENNEKGVSLDYCPSAIFL